MGLRISWPNTAVLGFPAVQLCESRHFPFLFSCLFPFSSAFVCDCSKGFFFWFSPSFRIFFWISSAFSYCYFHSLDCRFIQKSCLIVHCNRSSHLTSIIDFVAQYHLFWFSCLAGDPRSAESWRANCFCGLSPEGPGIVAAANSLDEVDGAGETGGPGGADGAGHRLRTVEKSGKR